MVECIIYNDGIKDRLEDIINADNQNSRKVTKTVKDIIDDVADNGDTALLKYVRKFDDIKINNPQELLFTEEEIEQAYNNIDEDILSSLKLAAKRIEDYHKKILPTDIIYKDDIGVELGNLWRPVESLAVYVPGGQAAYPSSVLMNTIPAKVAGVKNITMITPAPSNKVNPLVLAAAKICGIKKIYKIGGAQAIAALAYGTETIDYVDMIVGPGNKYVAEAKKQVYGTVGIDMVAGPSEILVVSDKNINPEWVAADLLSQAEHDEDARSILVSKDKDHIEQVLKEVDKLLKTLDRKDIAYKSWNQNGLVVKVKNDEELLDVINKIAPEHLELAIDENEAKKLLPKISSAGAVFLGRYTPEALGDYIAGPSHVLPTSGTAKFSSGLSVYTFLKRMSLINCPEDAFIENLSTSTLNLAKEEGLGAHALSVSIRTK